jgi:glyoxylase-like metal-dependent hydrolase (beta-lactamase superfamily II)
MTPLVRVSRRIFLADLGKGGVAAAVGIGLVACGGGSGDDDEETPPVAETSAPPASATEAPAGSGSGGSGAAATPIAPEAEGGGTSDLVAVEWGRANLGFVSAYVLARGGEAAIVDTGTPDSEGTIEAALGALGLGWDAVGHVIATHLHGDHVGSLPAVMEAAGGATGYAGVADLGGIRSPRELVGLSDGDRVFDLDIIGTPGHTAGHISVHDSVGGIFVAGDAISGADGGVIGANSQFTPDMALANESIAKIAQREFETFLFGHGEPVLSNGSTQVAALVS